MKKEIIKSNKATAKRAELDLAHKLQKAGWDAKRVPHSSAIRTSDLTGLPGIHISAVTGQRIDFWKALNQSLVNATTEGNGDAAAVFFKRQNPSSEWYVAMTLNDFIKIYGGKSNA